MRSAKFIRVLVLLAAASVACMATAEPVYNPPMVSLNNVLVGTNLVIPTINRQAELIQTLDRLSVTGAMRDTAIADFAKLPVGAQDAALSVISPTYASKVGLPVVPTTYRLPDVNIVRIDLTPRISQVIPSKGPAEQWVGVSGSMFSNECKVVFAGTELPTYYFLGALCFQAPTGKTLGTNYSLTVRNTKLNLDSRAAQFKVVAPMGYRGVHSWKFANFSTPTIRWAVFRDYFTPSAVEYSNGTHRPSAQEWYNSTYKGVGSGGDCYGMSLRSIRTKLSNWHGIYASWWPDNTQPTVWDYAKVDPQVVDSIREDQGGQLCAQAVAIINDRWNNQDHNEAWEFIRNSLDPVHPDLQPVLGMWVGNTKGHAVVAYRTEEVGNDRKIYVYDNNKPYSETELNDNNSVAHVYKSTNTFSYNYSGTTNANKMIAFRFNELVYPTPLLPADATGSTAGLASECTVVVFDSPTAVKQITDQQGRTFFSGTNENINPATRIPDSMRFVPLTGGDLPPDYPGIYVFNKSTGKSLTFDVDQAAVGTVRIFSPGVVSSIILQKGRFQLNKILTPDSGLVLSNPGQMNLQAVSMISVQPDKSERAFRLQNLQNLQQGNLGIRISPSLDGLLIDNALGSEITMGMTVRGLSNAGVQQSTLSGVSVPANRLGRVLIQDFRNLQAAPPRLEIQAR